MPMARVISCHISVLVSTIKIEDGAHSDAVDQRAGECQLVWRWQSIDYQGIEQSAQPQHGLPIRSGKVLGR